MCPIFYNVGSWLVDVGWWMLVGGCWLVVGWWMLVGGWLVDVGWWLVGGCWLVVGWWNALLHNELLKPGVDVNVVYNHACNRFKFITKCF